MATFIPAPLTALSSGFLPVSQTAGTSSSGVAGTTVAELAAAAGKVFVAWSVFASNGAAGTSQVIITYTDDTTTTVAMTSSTQLWGNAGGLLQASGIPNALSAKPVKKIRVETTGAGTTARGAAISGIEVAL